MKDLQARQQTLINLITRVGGRQNIQKWMDELLKIDVKLEIKEVSKMETFTIGQKIVHPTWGEGEVFAIMGKLVSAKFPGVGTKLVHDTSKLAVVNATQVKPANKEVVATKKPQTKKLEKAKNQLLALGVLEKSIMLENGVIKVIGADTQVVGNQTYYWDAKVFFDNNNGNVSINPNQVRNSQRKAYEDYKDLQGSKPCKSFEKWLQPQLANLPSLEVEVNKIDAPPARITVVEELNFWSLRVTRSVRHVQELSAAISHELKGSDCQDKATMVFLEKDVLIPLGGRDFFTTKNKDIKGVTEKNGNIKMFIREESFAPILEKLQAAAAKCGDSFTVDLCYSR
jgi:hypothetical protein